MTTSSQPGDRAAAGPATGTEPSGAEPAGAGTTGGGGTPDSPPQRRLRPGPSGSRSWLNATAPAVGLTLVLAGLAAAGAGLLLPWSYFDPASDHRPSPVIAGIVLAAGPGLSLVALALRWLGRGVPAAAARVALLGGLLAAGLAAIQTLTVGPSDGIGPGGPTTALAGLGTAVGWLVTGLARPVPAAPARGRRYGQVAVAAGAVLVIVTAAGWSAVRWYTDTRFVDSGTALAAAPGVPEQPGGLDRTRWQGAYQQVGYAGVIGTDLVVQDRTGMRGLDPATGATRWWYQRSDLRAVAATGTADGRTAVLLYGQGRGLYAVAVEAGTGVVRWTRELDRSAQWPWTTTLLRASAQTMVVSDLHTVLALDLRTGTPRWRQAGCLVDAIAATGATLAVARRCSGDGSDEVVALADDGATRWTWRPPYPPGFRQAGPLQLDTVDGAVLVRYGQFPQQAGDGTPVALAVPRSGVLLDAGTGTPAGTAHRVSGELVASGRGALVYLGGDAVAVDPTTGQARWQRPLTEVAGYRPVGYATAGGTGYVLLRGAAAAGALGDAGPLAVVAIDLAGGDVTATHRFPPDVSGCLSRSTGGVVCGPRPARLLVAGGTVVVAELTNPATGEFRLTALH